MSDKKLTSRAENFSERYNELVEKAGLADKSDVRGCMVIRPHGYALRENIQHILDTFFKRTGHQNAYFPLLIPKSYLSKEASHIEGFAKECAVVTHYRLKTSADGKEVIVDPEAKLEEELIIRPTSETIIRRSYKDRIQSYRDLPLLINQRANVMRWEMRTRIFLRTAEFLRHEGHTAHATAEEAKEETYKMHRVYQEFMEKFLAIYSFAGHKSESEKFAGAVETLTIEVMTQDGKALQCGTSHFLGQNFAKAFEVTFLNKQNETEYVRGTSRGTSTRLIGGLIMAHSDDKGLVLPPYIAPIHVVIVPIFKNEEELAAMQGYVDSLVEQLTDLRLEVVSAFGTITIPVNVIVDTDDQKSPGRKFAERELKGVPVRITIGKREMEQGVVEVSRRDTGEKVTIDNWQVRSEIAGLLHAIQQNLFEKNKQFRAAHTVEVNSREEFQANVEQWFVLAHWDGTAETEAKIKEETGATIRCIPLDQPDEAGACVLTGKPSGRRVLFAKAY